MSNQVSDSGLGEPPQAPVCFSTMYELLKMELLQFYMVLLHNDSNKSCFCSFLLIIRTYDETIHAPSSENNAEKMD